MSSALLARKCCCGGLGCPETCAYMRELIENSTTITPEEKQAAIEALNDFCYGGFNVLRMWITENRWYQEFFCVPNKSLATRRVGSSWTLYVEPLAGPIIDVGEVVLARRKQNCETGAVENLSNRWRITSPTTRSCGSYNFAYEQKGFTSSGKLSWIRSQIYNTWRCAGFRCPCEDPPSFDDPFWCEEISPSTPSDVDPLDPNDVDTDPDECCADAFLEFALATGLAHVDSYSYNAESNGLYTDDCCTKTTSTFSTSGPAPQWIGIYGCEAKTVMDGDYADHQSDTVYAVRLGGGCSGTTCPDPLTQYFQPTVFSAFYSDAINAEVMLTLVQIEVIARIDDSGLCSIWLDGTRRHVPSGPIGAYTVADAIAGITINLSEVVEEDDVASNVIRRETEEVDIVFTWPTPGALGGQPTLEASYRYLDERFDDPVLGDYTALDLSESGTARISGIGPDLCDPTGGAP